MDEFNGDSHHSHPLILVGQIYSGRGGDEFLLSDSQCNRRTLHFFLGEDSGEMQRNLQVLCDRRPHGTAERDLHATEIFVALRPTRLILPC